MSTKEKLVGVLNKKGDAVAIRILIDKVLKLKDKLEPKTEQKSIKETIQIVIPFKIAIEGLLMLFWHEARKELKIKINENISHRVNPKTWEVFSMKKGTR